MAEKKMKTVYRVRYTWDNRVKAVEVSEGPYNPRLSRLIAWVVVTAGAIACIVWAALW